MDFDGYAIGGLSVGEPRELTLEMIAEVLPLLPKDKPRYVMGVGYPDEIEQYARMGVDMMDCVLPTRAARHGLLFTSEGRLNIKGKQYAEDQGPPDPACDCLVCRRYSRAYLRHLMQAGEALSGTLNTIHNLAYYLGIMQRVRNSLRCPIRCAPSRLESLGMPKSPHMLSNSAHTRSSTPAQSPGAFCRNSRAVGYQGVLSVSCIQRQSARCGSRIHTGLPMAPARCAMQVSVVITRSSVATSAAVSARSRSRLEPSQTNTSLGRAANCSAASPFCSEIQREARRTQQRQQRLQLHGAQRVGLVARIARPGQPNARPWSEHRETPPASWRQCRVGSQVSARPGNRLDRGAEDRRQAHQRALAVKLRLRSQQRRLRQPGAHHGQRPHQPLAAGCTCKIGTPPRAATSVA